MLIAVGAIVFWSFCLPVLYLLGELTGFTLSRRDKIVDGVFFIALGWACLAYFLVVLGLFKSLSLVPVIAFMLAVLFFRRKRLRNFADWVKAVVSFFDLRLGVGTWGWYVRIGFLFSILLTFVFCMLPESSNDGLAYQLNLPKLFLQQFSIAPIEYELRSYRSFLQNVLYVIGLMFGNVPIAKLFHWITGVLLVLAVAAIVKQKTNDKDLGIFTGALLWLTPTLINQITTTYIDVGVTLYVFLSVYLLIGELQARKADIFYSGLLMGIAISIKFLAAIPCVSALAYLFWRILKNRCVKNECSKLMVWGAGIGIGCGFWFLRNWILTGNPFYPHFATWFNKDVSLENYFSFYDLQGLPRTWINYVLILWNLTVKLDKFDRYHWIGPAYLILLPLAVYGACKARKNLPYLFFIWLMITTWFFTAQLSRYLMPMFPFYLMSAAFGINFLRHRKVLFGVIKGINTALITFLFALSIYHFRISFLPLLRIWSTDQYLEYTERTTGIAKWINQNLPLNSKILACGEVRYFYFERTVVFEKFFSILSKSKNKTPAEIATLLKEKGFTHLLDGISLQTGAVYKRDLDLLIHDSLLARKVFTMISKNGREPKFIYNVYELI